MYIFFLYILRPFTIENGYYTMSELFYSKYRQLKVKKRDEQSQPLQQINKLYEVNILYSL